MLFRSTEDHETFCEKYGFRTRGGIRLSNKYPFIMLVYNPASKYIDYMDVLGDDSLNKIRYQKGDPNWNDNEALKNHKILNGIYHSVFLFRRSGHKLFYMGEYSLGSVQDNYFELDKIGEVSEEDEKVYYVEEVTGEEIICTELGDRNYVINGIFSDEDFRMPRTKDSVILPGDYLDKNFERINLGRIISLQFESINPHFVMENETTRAEQRVAHQLFLLAMFNSSIIAEVKDTDELPVEGTISEAFLYTVNVGCALTNFMVIKKNEKKEVWAIDWGSGLYYSLDAKSHIKDCLDDIRTTHFAGNSFKIKKIFISHGDKDHYNRIDDALIDNTTEIWTSGYHLVAGQYLNKMAAIQKKGSHFYMQLACNSRDEINILHPKLPIVFLPRRATFYGTGYYLTKEVNNVSPILEIKLNNEKCIFPGDIMEMGWQWFHTDTGCSSINTTVYVHTHHGSKNGFISNLPTVGDTEYDMITSEIDILSSRDNAYPGTIPSVEIQSRKEYDATYKTQIVGRELKYYKTDILSKKIDPIYV